ncbi:RnfABCDGE type electron transport complex subunit D [Tindallia californiensis]|uniref:Electron transport complex protein RnfD n=1 Tax=Tindallia californiensis TaxID=159292 RepID=A0A1H3K433_9FIRM|nr:RnfABCDGE type electron transport complex subunit D [Tindallia californiensis]SDY46274.1 electron transport complex protein RnfD [Tindallia californiensis]
MSQAGKLPVSSAPYLKDNYFLETAMRDVMIALLPISLVSIFFYGANAIFLIAICMATAALTEVVVRKIMGKKPSLYDGSAVLTGLFVALLYQPTAPWFSAVMATVIGVGVAKELSGGLGLNRFNPALFGRVSMILLTPVFAAFAPDALTLSSVEIVTQASPLALLGSGMEMPSYGEMFIGFQGGALSESSPLALMAGAAYLKYRKHIKLRVPLVIFATVVVIALATGQDPLYHLLSGGLMIGALFMATDWVTAPITYSGRVIFGLCIGVLVMIFRVFLPPTEGVAFSILIMNAFVPVIDKATRHLAFLEPKEA